MEIPNKDYELLSNTIIHLINVLHDFYTYKV